MKLFALVVLYKPESGEPVILKGGYDLSSFSFFQRTSVQEFIKFTSKIMADKTAAGARQSVKEAEYMCHCFARDDSLAGICMADEEYPHRVAHTLISKILDDFTGQVPRDQWAAGAEVMEIFLNTIKITVHIISVSASISTIEPPQKCH